MSFRASRRRDMELSSAKASFVPAHPCDNLQCARVCNQYPSRSVHPLVGSRVQNRTLLSRRSAAPNTKLLHPVLKWDKRHASSFGRASRPRGSCAMQSFIEDVRYAARFAPVRYSPSSPCSRWRSGSARTRPSSASSTRRSCVLSLSGERPASEHRGASRGGITFSPPDWRAQSHTVSGAVAMETRWPSGDGPAHS
jgi:hypothetical protein